MGAHHFVGVLVGHRRLDVQLLADFFERAGQEGDDVLLDQALGGLAVASAFLDDAWYIGLFWNF